MTRKKTLEERDVEAMEDALGVLVDALEDSGELMQVLSDLSDAASRVPAEMHMALQQTMERYEEACLERDQCPWCLAPVADVTHTGRDPRGMYTEVTTRCDSCGAEYGTAKFPGGWLR